MEIFSAWRHYFSRTDIEVYICSPYSLKKNKCLPPKRGDPGGLSRECVLRIPMRVVKGD